ncbi:MAG TPA: IS3 family transposase [Candidatus Sulfotelmatobacter sp.]|nr:IS3 family transposase [Candidatus Sulfotelmatobacter sp.]
MKGTRHSEEQIIAILKQGEAGLTTAELCRQHGITEQTYYRWKAKYGGMDSSEAKKLKQLEDENRKLKHVVADLTLDNRALKDVLFKKLVTPAGLRAVVSYVEVEYQMSERHACRLMGLGRSTHRYRARKGRDAMLRMRLKELAARRMRFGYRRLTAMLGREGMQANHKRVYRLYREEGLAMRIRQRRRIRWTGAAVKPAASQPNERWSMDFVTDCVSSGKVIRMLTIVDDYTRECPAIEVDISLGGLRVRRVLDRIASERGLPEAIVLDNGPEFRGRALAAWSEERGVRLEFIQPGKPVQNAYAESFNGRLRDECLNANWFTSLSDARRKIETWRQDYNQQRPHSSLDYLPPAEFARKAAEITE